MWLRRVLCCVLALCSVAAWGQAATGPAVLFVTNWGRASGGNEEYLKRLVDGGMRVHTTAFDKVTPELLAKFDAVVIPALPPVDPRAGAPSTSSIKPADNEKLLAALDGYINAGGGLLFAGPLWGWDIGWPHLEATNAYLKQWNAEVAPELVLDKQNLYRQRIFMQNPYSFTRNVAPSPVSEGVHTVWVSRGPEQQRRSRAPFHVHAEAGAGVDGRRARGDDRGQFPAYQPRQRHLCG